jgi:hypothetical protein
MSIVRRVPIRGPNNHPVALSQDVHFIDVQKTALDPRPTDLPENRPSWLI